MTTPESFVEALRKLKFEDTFNPYSDQCTVHDLYDAPSIRSKTLGVVLEAATQREIDSLWIGRDLGYGGGRRTGLAFTDDVHLRKHVERWGVPFERPTKGKEVQERTATAVWSILLQIKKPVFLWNVFPLHSHNTGNPRSNRPHNTHERKAGEKLLSQLIHLLEPHRLIAVGRDAEKVAHSLRDGHEVIYVRHPAYGGQKEFRAKMCALYSLGKGRTVEKLRP